MSIDGRQSTRSPTNSRTDSYRGAPTSRTNDRPYQRRLSITEENGKEYNEYEAASDVDEQPRNELPPPRSEDQYIAALRYRFPSRPKTDYSYSKPPGPPNPPPPPAPPTTQPTTTTTTPGATSTSRSGPYQSSVRPTTGSISTPDTSDGRTFPRPALRRISPDQQNTYARRITGETATSTSQTIPATPGQNVRINEQDINANKSDPSTFTRQSDIRRAQESIFEKIPSHGGPVSYLGTGTFSQFEHCLQECLERERRQTGIASQIIRQDIPPNISTHDYGYDSVSTPLPQSTSHHQFIDYPTGHISTFSLDDIRYINAALSRSGISLFPYHRPYHDSYPSPIPLSNTPTHSIYPSGRRIIGEVVSACRLVEEDATSLFNRNGSEAAVQNVWNAIQNHQPFSYIDPSRSNISPRGPYNI